MRLHAIVDAGGNLVASGVAATEGDGPRVQLGALPGHTHHELELPSEFEGRSPREVHEKLEASDLKQYIVVPQ
jgi:hypothetical protein